VQKQTQSFSITNFTKIKQQLLHWANQYSSCSFLDSHHYKHAYNEIECIVGAGALQFFSPINNEQKAAFHHFLANSNDWLFGHIAYNYTQLLYPSIQNNYTDNIGFAPILFFQPAIVVQLYQNKLVIESYTENPAEIFTTIQETSIQTPISTKSIQLQPKISKENYLQSIEQLQQHIARGDCYEINFCQEFFSSSAVINPVDVYEHLTKISPNPFACFYRQEHQYLLCASPERYLKKTNETLVSQPIKGTFKRNLTNKQEDEILKQELYQNHKERSENVMVVDLVRNDLSKICKEGSVEVEELFGIYSFPQVHQMISTIKGKVFPTTNFMDMIDATFPMGSMTGAPKKRVIELINEFEKSNRGLYSGAVGYIAPNRDFDFNVVIRSLLYNSTTQYLSYQVGSGITFNSVAVHEYEECLLKASAMVEVLKATIVE